MTEPAPNGGVLVVHAFIARDGTLAVWGETDEPRAELVSLPAELVSPPAELGGAPPAAGRPRRRAPSAGVAGHPFAVALGQVNREPATLLLPSTSAGPLPSPALGLRPRRGRPRLRAWRVPAVTVESADGLLDPGAPSGLRFPGEPAGLPDPIEAAGRRDADVRPAPSVRWLAELSAFAGDLVRRGRVLPRVLLGGPEPRARWRPVITGADAARHADLLPAHAARGPGGTDPAG